MGLLLSVNFMFGFYVLFIPAAFIVIYVFVAISNKQSAVVIDRFTTDAERYHPLVLRNIRLRYWEKNGSKSKTSPGNVGDVYLFDDCIVLVRRLHFIYRVSFAPVVIVPGVATAQIPFSYLDTYKADKLFCRTTKMGEVVMHLSTPRYKDHSIEITLKRLTEEETGYFKKMEVL